MAKKRDPFADNKGFADQREIEARRKAESSFEQDRRIGLGVAEKESQRGRRPYEPETEPQQPSQPQPPDGFAKDKERLEKLAKDGLSKVKLDTSQGFPTAEGFDKIRFGLLKTLRDLTGDRKHIVNSDGSIVSTKKLQDGQRRITITSPPGGKPQKKFEPVETPEGRKNETEEWVMILPLRSYGSATDCIGIMIVNQDFEVIKYFENDQSGEFRKFATWDEFYGFVREWQEGPPDRLYKYKLEELPRLSQMWMDYEDWIEGHDDHDDTYWQPGYCPAEDIYQWADQSGDFPTSPVWQGRIFFNFYLASPTELSQYSDENHRYYRDNTWYFAPPHSWGNVDDWYNQPRYATTGEYSIDGLSFQPDRIGSFVLLNAYADVAEGYQTRNIFYMMEWDPGYPTYTHYSVEGAAPWPPDGIQTRTTTDDYAYTATFAFQDNQRNVSEVKFTVDWAGTTTISSYVEGLWTMDQQTVHTRTEITSSEWNDSCCTVRDPEYCLEQDIFAFADYWIYLGHELPGESQTVSYSPCYYSYYWHYTQNHGSPPQPVMPNEKNYKIRFDDGHIENMAEHLSYQNTYDAYTYDLAIYGWEIETDQYEPVRVGHYAYPHVYDQVVLDHCLFYRYNGEFRRSEIFQNVATDLYHRGCIIAFDCLAQYEGYWNGSVRVAKLTKTEIITEKRNDGEREVIQ